MTTPPLERAVVEELVRRSVLKHLRQAGAKSGTQPHPLVINISARHCHLRPDAVETLFGAGRQLTPMRWLYQEGQFASEEVVTLIGPRSRVISNLRILGPCRDINQVEVAFTDAISLGFEVPVRISGNIVGTPGCMLMGPAGFLEMEEGVIRAAPHVHMAPEDAASYGVENKTYMKLRISGKTGLTFDRIFVRVDPAYKLEVHLDTDEANACGLGPDTPCELIK